MPEILYPSSADVPAPSHLYRVMVVSDAEVANTAQAEGAFREFTSSAAFKAAFYRDIPAKLIASARDLEFVLGIRRKSMGNVSVYPLEHRANTVSSLRNPSNDGPVFSSLYVSDKPLIQEANDLDAHGVVVPLTLFNFLSENSVRERLDLLAEGQPDRALISSKALAHASADERLRAELGTTSYRNFDINFQGLSGTEIFSLFYPNSDVLGPNAATLAIVEQIAMDYQKNRHLRVLDFNSHVGLFASALILNGVTGIDRLHLLPRDEQAAHITHFNIDRALKFSRAENQVKPTIGSDSRIRSNKPYDIIHVAIESFDKGQSTKPSPTETLAFAQAIGPILPTMITRKGIALCRMPYEPELAQSVINELQHGIPAGSGYSTDVLNFPTAQYVTVSAR